MFLETFTEYFLWPPAFGDQGTESLCLTHKQDLDTDLYCSVGMRQVAESFGRSLPARGCTTVELLDWQIAQSKHMLDKVQSEIKPGRKRKGLGGIVVLEPKAFGSAAM